MDNNYLENLKGSPYIDEASLNPINKVKTGVSNFINKFKNGSTSQRPVQTSQSNPSSQPAAQSNPNNPSVNVSNESQLNFLKIVEKVCEMLNRKIESDPSMDKQEEPQAVEDPTKKYASVEKSGGNVPLQEDDKPEKTNSRDTTKLNVANNEEKAGGWLNWFQGHYAKSRKFGLDLNIEDEVVLSGNKIKKLKLKWSNASHENRIIVLWENNQEKMNVLSLAQQEKEKAIGYAEKEKAGGNVPFEESITEAEHTPERGEFMIFMFYDDQVVPSSPSFKNPTIGMLLHQANPRSNLVMAVMSNKKLESESPRLISNLHHVVEKKWKEFKGHKKDTEVDIEKKDGKLFFQGKELELNDVLAGLNSGDKNEQNEWWHSLKEICPNAYTAFESAVALHMPIDKAMSYTSLAIQKLGLGADTEKYLAMITKKVDESYYKLSNLLK